MNTKIISLTLLVDNSSYDILYIKFDLPSTEWPFEGNAVAKLNISQGKGIEYVNKHFSNIELRIISSETGKEK